MHSPSETRARGRSRRARVPFRVGIGVLVAVLGSTSVVGLAEPASAASAEVAEVAVEEAPSVSSTGTERPVVDYDLAMLAMAGGLVVVGTALRRLRQPVRRVADPDAYRRAFPSCGLVPVDAQPERALHERIDVQTGYRSATGSVGRAVAR